MASFVLVVQSAGQPPQEREFSKDRVVLGREVGDLVIPDPRCSSTHCEIVFDGRTLSLRDLGSSNGTWVAGQRVTTAPLTTGSSITIGGFVILVKEIRGDVPAKGRTMLEQPMVMPPMPGPPAGGPPAGAPPPGHPQAPGGPPQAYGAPAGGYGAPPPNYGAPGFAAAPANYGPPQGYGQAPPKKSNATLYWLLGGGAAVLVLGMCGVAGVAAIAANSGSMAETEPGSSPTLTEAREQTVKFVWFAGEPGPTAKGGTANARIRVGPNKSGIVSVGVFEEYAGGGGNQWRTATWLAAFNATRPVGASLSDYEFAVHVGGHTDGPSAGMLTTATMLALLRNDKVRDDTTMTGTVNPDGSAGPVGGIVQKMEGAKASGLKRFGFPVGCRNHKDMKTGQTVDLVAFGASIGLEAKEINDLGEAYQFVTGKDLPHPTAVAETEMEIPVETNALLKAKLGTWKTRGDREIDGLRDEVKKTGRAVEGAADLITGADKALAKAKRFEQNGFTGAALDAYAQAAITVAVATRMTRAIYQISNGQLGSLIEGMQSAERVKSEVDAFGDQLEIKAKNSTRGGQLRTASSFAHYVTARSAAMIGSDFQASATNLIRAIQAGQVKATRETFGTLLLKVTIPIIYYDMAHVFLDYARDMQDMIGEEGAAKPLDGAALDRAVSGYASASGAVLEYFDALIVDELAKSQGVTKEDAQFYVAQQESEYYLARKANMLATNGSAGKQASNGYKLMRLAASTQSYLAGGKLVNKHYSLGGRFDKQGNLVLENRRALSAQIELARKNAREAAAQAKAKAGFIPTPARVAYQAANADREGTDEEKLDALTRYWESAFYSELAAQK